MNPPQTMEARTLLGYELPPGWTLARPEEVADKSRNALAIGPFGSNLKVSDYQESGVPLVFVRNIKSGRFMGPDAKFVSQSKATQLEAHTVTHGDILITKMGDPPGDAAIYPLATPGIITADCIKLTPHPQINPKYLLWLIRSDLVRSQILGLTKGVAQLKVSLGRFRNEVLLPLAPTPEQERIAAALEKLFSHLDAGIESLELVRSQLRRMGKVLLQAAIEGRLVSQDNLAPSAVVLAKVADEERRGRWAEHANASAYMEPSLPASDVLTLTVPSNWLVTSLEAITDPVRTIRYGILMPKKDIADGVPYVRVKDMQEIGRAHV